MGQRVLARLMDSQIWHQLASSVEGGLRKQTMAFAHLDARHFSVSLDTILEGISQEQSPTPVPPAQDSSARKVSPHNFWLQNPAGIESVEETSGAPSSSS